MASNMIHYAISEKVLELISVSDRQRFLFGGSLVPDASAHEDRSYDEAHCWDETTDPHHWGINWRWFSDRYGSLLLEDDLYLGYYIHLIQDALWFHDVVDPLIRIYPKSEQKPVYQKGYRDYLRLNYLLQQKYHLVPFPSDMDLTVPFKAIRSDRMKEAFRLFEERFEAQPCTEDDLELYTWDIIEPYIEKSVAICVREVEALRRHETGTAPVTLFVGQRKGKAVIGQGQNSNKK